MGVTRLWDETNPVGTQNISTGPTFFVNHQVDIRERMNNAGQVWNNANKALDGLHAVNADTLGGPGPDIYKSDFSTKIVQWTDTQANLLAGYLLVGSKNIVEATLADDIIIDDSKGYKRTIQALKVTQSSPADAKVNVNAGLAIDSRNGGLPKFFAGGNLQIGIAPLVQPAAGNHAYYTVVLIPGASYATAFTLNAQKGTEVLIGNQAAPTPPNAFSNPIVIAIIDIQATSTLFTLASSGANAFLVLEGRADASAQ